VFLSTFPQKTLLVDFDLFEYLQDILQQHIFTNYVCRFKRNIAEIGKNERSNQNDTYFGYYKQNHNKNSI